MENTISAHDSDPEQELYSTVTHDISDRKGMVEALQKSEQRFAAIMLNLQDMGRRETGQRGNFLLHSFSGLIKKTVLVNQPILAVPVPGGTGEVI